MYSGCIKISIYWYLMLKKILTIIGLIVLVLVISQLIGLLSLWYGLKTFDTYWNNRAQKEGDFIYVALGDSAAQGVGASKPANGYVGLIATHIQESTGRTVRVINLS